MFAALSDYLPIDMRKERERMVVNIRTTEKTEMQAGLYKNIEALFVCGYIKAVLNGF